MSRQLPARPNLRHLRHQAKTLHRAFQAGDPDAVTRLQEHHPGAGTADAFTLQDSQLVVAREYGYASWPLLVAAVDEAVPEVTVTPGPDPSPAEEPPEPASEETRRRLLQHDQANKLKGSGLS